MKILLESKNVTPSVLGTVRHFVVNLCCAEANSSKLILTIFIVAIQSSQVLLQHQQHTFRTSYATQFCISQVDYI